MRYRTPDLTFGQLHTAIGVFEVRSGVVDLPDTLAAEEYAAGAGFVPVDDEHADEEEEG